MKISRVAKKFNLTVETLHYWELIGLIPPVNRDASGNRDYDQEDLAGIKFVKCMRLAGVSVKTLQRYLRLFSEGTRTKDQRKELLRKQLHRIDKKLKYFKRCHDLLSWKIKHYDFLDRNYHGKLRR